MSFEYLSNKSLIPNFITHNTHNRFTAVLEFVIIATIFVNMCMVCYRVHVYIIYTSLYVHTWIPPRSSAIAEGPWLNLGFDPGLSFDIIIMYSH